MLVGDACDLAPEIPATTEFGQSDTEFALRFQIATSMLTTKVRILKKEFTRRDGYCPIEAVSSRIKAPDSIVAMAQRVCCPLTVDDICTNILDIAGVHVHLWACIGLIPDRSAAQLARRRHSDRGRRLGQL